MKIIQSPSPNFSKTDYTKIGVQIHKTLGLMPSTLNWLRNPISFSSAHYLIAKNGDVHQLVQLKDRAWTAGRIKNISERARKIMMKTPWGTWVKPGEYLIQIEVECLLEETYTEEQFASLAELFSQFDFQVGEENFLTHRDTASYKPYLEDERSEILARLYKPDVCDDKKLVLDNWGQLRIETKDGKIVLYKKL